MKTERKSIIEFLRSLFRKEKAELEDFPAPPSNETVNHLLNRALGDNAAETTKKDTKGDQAEASAEGASDEVSDKAGATKDSGEGADSDEEKAKESCPYATRRAIVESIAEIRRFAEENKLATSVLKALLTLLAEIALGTMKGKVSRHILETLLRAINYEFAVDEAFKKGHIDGRNKLIEERYPLDDDGLPHINGPLFRPDGTSIFDVAAEARN